jgi:phenylacetate-CoA ligase
MTSNISPLIPASSLSSVAWPAMPSPTGAAMLALQYQLNQTQWLSPEALQAQQFRQLQSLLTHAYETIPFYRDRLDTVGFKPHHQITPEQFLSLALLRRSEIQSAGESLLSQRPPKDHGRILAHQTSGSTGRPIKAFGTDITQFFWNALTLRDHLWHKRDFSGKLASIRTTVEDGVAQGWGPATDAAFKTGQIAMLNIRADIDRQLQWLQTQNPDYLLSHPSNILALANGCIQKRIPLTKLREVRAFGETVTPELRAACREAWGVPVKDAYSAQEVGYIALQCPEHEHYHIQSENLLVEILNDENQACEPGEIGRVVITTLHNFAMPLIRYEILDYAEVGEPCPCGRGLPVIKRIMGRQRNLVTLPNGTRHWPSFPAESWAFIAPIRQIQLVQRELDSIEARLVTDRPLTTEEARALVAVLQEHLGYPFQITFQYKQKIERKANFKYEDFISEIPT